MRLLLHIIFWVVALLDDHVDKSIGQDKVGVQLDDKQRNAGIENFHLGIYPDHD